MLFLNGVRGLTLLTAADFGLAVFFEPASLPRRDLGLEGTPWFMSPETLSSEVSHKHLV